MCTEFFVQCNAKVPYFAEKCGLLCVFGVFLSILGDMTKPKSTNLSIRLEMELKKDAEELFGSLGMSLTTAFNVFLRQSLKVQGLPFSVTRRREETSGPDGKAAEKPEGGSPES